MLYTILGFSQELAIEYGLKTEDLLLLRWFVDFSGSQSVKKIEYEGKIYTWIKYDYMLKQIPIVNCTKKTLAVKLGHLVSCGVLENKTIKDGGCFSVYCLGERYESLISGSINHPYAEKSVTPMPKNRQPPMPKNRNTKINLSKEINLSEDSIYSPYNPPQGKIEKNEEAEKVKTKSTRFNPPTAEEVNAYCAEKGYNIDGETFVDHYTSNGWMVGRTKMKDWKAAVRTWVRNQNNNGYKSNKKSDGKIYGATGHEIDPTLTDLDDLF